MVEILQYAEVKNQGLKEINAKVAQFRKELFELRMEKASSGVKKTQDFARLRKNIARLLTAKNVIENGNKHE